jgi:hypothetical protein
MLRQKHYARADISARAKRYVLTEGMSYRQAVSEMGMPLFHAHTAVASHRTSERDKDLEETPILSHTTLFRWLTTLGKSVPDSAAVHRIRIAVKKSRDPVRRRLLNAFLRHFGAK